MPKHLEKCLYVRPSCYYEPLHEKQATTVEWLLGAASDVAIITRLKTAYGPTHAERWSCHSRAKI